MIFLQGVVQSIQNGNNMHREVYKDLHKECTFVYTKVYKGAHIMQKYTKVQIENNNCTTEFVLAWRRQLACYSVVYLVRKATCIERNFLKKLPSLSSCRLGLRRFLGYHLPGRAGFSGCPIPIRNNVSTW